MRKVSLRIISGKRQLRKFPRNSSLGLFPNPTELSFQCSFSIQILSIHYVQMRPFLNSLVSSLCTSSVSADCASCWLSDGNRHQAKPKYSSTPLIRINLDGETSGNAENPDNWIFLWKYSTWAVWSSAVNISSMYLRQNLSTVPDLQF